MTTRLLVLGALVLSLFACTKNKDTKEKIIHLYSEAKVSGFDPVHGGDMYTGAEMGKVYEGLYEFHPIKRPYELMPNLAEDLPQVSADGLTYTYKIKKGVMFRDDPCFKDGKGRELTAQDVVFSLKRHADPKLSSRGWWLFDEKIQGLNEWRKKNEKTDQTNYDEEVPGLIALDSHTVQVKLVKAYPQLNYALAMQFTFVVAREAVTHYGKEFLNHPVGTGPFILEKFEQTNKIVYTKNPNYREKYYPDGTNNTRVPGVDKMVVHIITEAQPRWLEFNKGKLDKMGVAKDYHEKAIIDNKVAPDLAEKGIKLSYAPQLDVVFYAMNYEDKYLKNTKLRQALSMAYDRATTNKLFYNNTGVIAHGVIPPGMAGYRADFKNPFVEYNIEKAKQLLREAGYPDGKGLPEITLQTTNSTDNRQSAEHFVKCMAAIGVKVKVNMNTWPELVNKVTKKQHQIYTMAWGADYPDAENFLGLLYCPNQAPGSNGANYCNPKFDELYRKATTMQDTPERTKLYEQLNEMVSLDVPWIFVVHRTKYFLYQSWLKNYEIMEFDHSQYQYMAIDPEEKTKLLKKF